MKYCELTTEQELHDIIEKRVPRGLFLYDTGIEIIGVDNLTGDAWTDEFPDRQECEDWLLHPEKEWVNR